MEWENTLPKPFPISQGPTSKDFLIFTNSTTNRNQVFDYLSLYSASLIQVSTRGNRGTERQKRGGGEEPEGEMGGVRKTSTSKSCFHKLACCHRIFKDEPEQAWGLLSVLIAQQQSSASLIDALLRQLMPKAPGVTQKRASEGENWSPCINWRAPISPHLQFPLAFWLAVSSVNLTCKSSCRVWHAGETTLRLPRVGCSSDAQPWLPDWFPPPPLRQWGA